MENIDPIYWGNKLWYMMYSFIAVYPNNPTNQQIENIMSFFETLKYLLPCCSCKTSYIKFTSEEDTNITDKNNFTNKNNAIIFIFNLRKKVEKKIGYEYCTTKEYLTFKLHNMICNNNINEYDFNKVHEAPFIPEDMEDKVINYVTKYKTYITKYDDKTTKSMINKLKHFLKNPSVSSNYFLLWIERNLKCRELINKIEENMVKKNYNTVKSFHNDKKLHIRLFYLGSTYLSVDMLKDVIH